MVVGHRSKQHAEAHHNSKGAAGGLGGAEMRWPFTGDLESGAIVR